MTTWNLLGPHFSCCNSSVLAAHTVPRHASESKLSALTPQHDTLPAPTYFLPTNLILLP